MQFYAEDELLIYLDKMMAFKQTEKSMKGSSIQFQVLITFCIKNQPNKQKNRTRLNRQEY